MDRKERIFSYISSNTYVPLKFNELAIVLDVPEEDLIELSRILDSLVREGRIYKTKKGRYCVVSTKGLTVSGKLICNAAGGFGFVRPDEESAEDIFIPGEKLGFAYDGDRVLVRIDNKDNAYGHSEGHIYQVLERGNKTIVGVVESVKNKIYKITPDRREFFANIRVGAADIGGAKTGDRVLVEINEYDLKGRPFGTVKTVLGTSESVLGCLNGLIAENSLSARFPKEVLDEAEKIPQSVTEREIEGREDFRAKKIFTIDGDDSRDFDDAVSLEDLPNGNMLLGVHIADVTHYVKEGSLLDKEAFKRGTSVYFPHKVIPMLPKKLSNGICSLNPEVDRLTLSVMMETDDGGNIYSHRIVRSVIHSCARMTYGNVNKILAGDTRLRERYSDLTDIFERMDKLSDALAEKRRQRGAIDFDFPETYVVCDDEGNPVEVKMRERGKAERLIESFMLAANETVAEAAFWAELPFVYRVHESPSDDKLSAFNDFIKNFGYSFKGKTDSESVHPKDLQTILEKAKGTPEETMISRVALRSLMKAEYKETNDGHFGLAARFYCHYTSPIRRYPDLMIHRVIKSYIEGTLTESKNAFYESRVRDAAAHSSETEITAEKAERDAVDLLKTAYMRAHIGESFDAVVSSVTSFGMFAMLENSCEGLIRCENMLGDYFEYNEGLHCLTGKRTRQVYKIGDRIRITVAGCNILMRRIDFVLEEDNTPEVMARIEKRERKAMRRNDKNEKHKKRGFKPHRIKKSKKKRRACYK